MSGPILNKGHQAFGFVQKGKNLAHNFQIGTFRAAAEIVDFTGLAVFNGRQDAQAMVTDINPVAHVLAISIYGQRLILAGAFKHEWNEFFRKLVRSVIIGAAGGDDRKIIGMKIGPGQKVRGGF